MTINPDISVLEKNICYEFKDKNFLKLALTHSSYVHEKMINKVESNERIEFLGDAVLELVSSDFLYHEFPNMQEGELTKLRASLVCEPSLAAAAREIGLPDFINLGVGENKTGGRKRDSVTSDAFESVIGAIYLDSGIEEARKFILRFVLNDIEKHALFHDSKSKLQEYAQEKYRSQVEYRIVSESGPDHDKCFVAQAFINGNAFSEGSGHTKKAAEQAAAFETLKKLNL